MVLFSWWVNDSELDIDNWMPILFFQQPVDVMPLMYFLWYWKEKAQGQPNWVSFEKQTNVLFLPGSLQNCFSIFRIQKFWPKHSWMCVCACTHVHMCEKFLCIISLSTSPPTYFIFFSFYNSYISHIMLLGYVLCQSLCVFTLTKFQDH